MRARLGQQVTLRAPCDPLEHDTVLIGVWVRETPIHDQLAHVLPEGQFGFGANGRRATFGVRRELREQTQQRLGDDLMRRFRGASHQRQHGLQRHALRRVQNEPAPLRDIAAHLQQAAQLLGIQRADELRDALLQPGGFRGLRRRQLVGNLQQVTDDDLIVRLLAFVGVDRLGHDEGVGACAVVRQLGLQRRLCQLDPELCHPILRSDIVGVGFGFVDELELIVGHREQPDVVPGGPTSLRAECGSVTLRIGGERAEQLRDLVSPDAGK